MSLPEVQVRMTAKLGEKRAVEQAEPVLLDCVFWRGVLSISLNNDGGEAILEGYLHLRFGWGS